MNGRTGWLPKAAALLMIGLAFVARECLAQPAGAAALTRGDVEALADSVFGRYVRESAAPSLAVVIVRGGEILLAKGYGVEHDSVPVSPESTLFYIASLSKVFVTTAVMQLTERGLVRLDDPVAKWLPELNVSPRITVRHLLTHTSGIDSPFQPGVVHDSADLRPLAEYFAEHPARFGRPVGEEIRYSNYGMALAARVVEKISGKQFDDYVEQQIFKPLGMQHSSIRQPPPKELSDRIATAGAGGLPGFLLLYPAGAIVSTPNDMGRFLVALLRGDKTDSGSLLSTQSVAEMQRRQWTARPDIPGVALGLFESDMEGVRGLFHTGARLHFSVLYLVPSERVGVFVVHSMRQGGPFQPLRTSFVRAFLRRYFGKHEPYNRFQARSSASFEGVYRPVLFSPTSIERAAALFTDTRVIANSDGSIDVQVPFGKRLHAVRERAATFRVHDGDQEGLSIGFGDSSEAPRRMFFSGATQDPVSFDRLRWYQRGLLHLVLLVIAFVVIASYSVVVMAIAVWRTLVRKPGQSVNRERESWFMLVASVSMLLTPVATVVMLLGAGTLSGPQRAISVGVTLLFGSSVLALSSIPIAIASNRGHASQTRQIYRWILAASSLVFFGLAVHYHLGPFWL